MDGAAGLELGQGVDQRGARGPLVVGQRGGAGDEVEEGREGDEADAQPPADPVVQGAARGDGARGDRDADRRHQHVATFDHAHAPRHQEQVRDDEQQRARPQPPEQGPPAHRASADGEPGDPEEEQPAERVGEVPLGVAVPGPGGQQGGLEEGHEDRVDPAVAASGAPPSGVGVHATDGADDAHRGDGQREGDRDPASGQGGRSPRLPVGLDGVEQEQHAGQRDGRGLGGAGHQGGQADRGAPPPGPSRPPPHRQADQEQRGREVAVDRAEELCPLARAVVEQVDGAADRRAQGRAEQASQQGEERRPADEVHGQGHRVEAAGPPPEQLQPERPPQGRHGAVGAGPVLSREHRPEGVPAADEEAVARLQAAPVVAVPHRQPEGRDLEEERQEEQAEEDAALGAPIGGGGLGHEAAG